MPTVTFTLTPVDHGTQDWADVETAIHRVLPINRDLKIRDGLSGDIDTYVNGMRVTVTVTPDQPGVDLSVAPGSARHPSTGR